jgi:hypothetical protein
MLAQGKTQDEAISAAMGVWDASPMPEDPEGQVRWETDREVVASLLAGYAWRWSESPLKFVASEFVFNMPIVNPATGRPVRGIVAAGKVDAVVNLDGTRLAVDELKTTGDDIGPESDLWQRVRIDQQISLYVLGARHAGHAVETVLYDVVRKPSIRLKQKETPADFGKRLLDDIGTRPDFYFARREIPRLQSDLEEFRAELWQAAMMLRECKRRQFWPRNTAACLIFSRCPYFDLCLSGWKPNAGALPSGYVVIDTAHPELESEGVQS